MSKIEELFLVSGSRDTEATLLANQMFYDAATNSASDIHLQEHNGDWTARFRGPEGIYPYKEFSSAVGTVISEKIKNRSNISIMDRRTAHDGRFSLKWEDKAIDVRVAITPNVVGQFICCRILDQSKASYKLDDLGLPVATRMAFEALLKEPDGLFLVTGPTGSGKTTTLYAILNELHNGSRNIITIEDPVEYIVKGLVQIGVDAHHLTFAQALRTVLRQDPDVILIGEIRDAETAEIAVQAAMTGHLVLATLHADNATIAPLRLMEMGVNARVLSSSLRGVCAQRLVKKNIGNIVNDKPSELDMRWMEANGIPWDGSNVCVSAETKGYIPIIEIFMATHEIREIIGNVNFNEDDLLAMVNKQPWFNTLAKAAADRVFHGNSTISEAKRITSMYGARQLPMRYGELLIQNGGAPYCLVQSLVDQHIDMKNNGSEARFGELLRQNLIAESSHLKAINE